MIIDNLRSERQQGRARVAATVRWEDAVRPTQDIYFETLDEFAPDLTCNPDAFLVGALIPAVHHGEKRVRIDEEVCPELLDGLTVAMNLLRHWYYTPVRNLPCIEVRKRRALLRPDKATREGMFFSGGVDAWTTLRKNRLHFDETHPGYFKDALVVYGLFREEPDDFQGVLMAAIESAREAGLTPIPVWTNLVSLGHGWDFWGDEGEGAVFAAIGHVFANRLSAISLASTFDIPQLHPHGSHPMLDPCYSSGDLRIKHDAIQLSRLMKVQLIADWDLALRNLRVCNKCTHISQEKQNCGECEKCLRTMLALTAVGALGRATSFAVKEVSPALIERAVYMDKTTSPFYRELLPPLESVGRHELVAAIGRKLGQYRRIEREMRLRARLKKFDAMYFGSKLLLTKRWLFQLQ